MSVSFRRKTNKQKQTNKKWIKQSNKTFTTDKQREREREKERHTHTETWTDHIAPIDPKHSAWLVWARVNGIDVSFVRSWSNERQYIKPSSNVIYIIFSWLISMAWHSQKSFGWLGGIVSPSSSVACTVSIEGVSCVISGGTNQAPSPPLYYRNYLKKQQQQQTIAARFGSKMKSWQ